MAENETTQWTFLTNHSHVLLCLYEQPDMRLREVAVRVGITERSVHRIIHELADYGALTILREGRRNHYVIDGSLHLRHPVEAHRTLEDILKLVKDPGDTEACSDAPEVAPQ